MGYSQEEFADIAGFSRSYYTEIETGKRNISILNVIKIMEALKVDPNEIIGFLKPK
jgi:transcriptional regulator with XRE-family HTH domain